MRGHLLDPVPPIRTLRLDVPLGVAECVNRMLAKEPTQRFATLAEAAIVGVPHPKWQERPLLLVVRRAGQDVTREDLLEFLAARVARWWLPDDVVFVAELPHTATGKMQKIKLREQFKDHVLPTA